MNGMLYITGGIAYVARLTARWEFGSWKLEIGVTHQLTCEITRDIPPRTC